MIGKPCLPCRVIECGRKKYAETLQEYTSDAGFNTSLYMVPNDVGCYFGGPPGVAPEPVQNLDKNKFAGRWYQHRIDKRQYSFQGGVNSKCASNLFTPKTDPVTGNVYIDNVGSAQIGDNVGSDKFKISHSAITPAADGSGVTSVYFPPGDLFPNSPAIKASEWVVDVGGDADGKYEWHIATDGPKYNAMFLNTRETVLKPEILQHFKDYIKSSGYWQDVVEQSQPSNCKYASKAPAQAPAPAPAAPAPPSKTPSPGTLSTSIWVVICLVCLVAGAGITLLGLRSRVSSERSKSYISLADSNA